MEFYRAMTNSRVLNAKLKNCTVEELEEFVAKLTEVRDEKLNRENDLNYGYTKIAGEVEELRKKAALWNVPLEHVAALVQGFSPNGRRRRQAAPRYRYVNLAGTTREWTGQGIIPNDFKELLEATHTTREDYLIPVEEGSEQAE